MRASSSWLRVLLARVSSTSTRALREGHAGNLISSPVIYQPESHNITRVPDWVQIYNIDFGRWPKTEVPCGCYSHCCGGTEYVWAAVVSEPLFVVPSVLTYHHRGNMITCILHGGHPADLHVHVCTSI